MKISIINSTGYADDQVFWMITGQQTIEGAATYVYVTQDGTPTAMSTGDNTNSITQCGQTHSYANYGFSLATASSITVDDTVAIAGGVIFISIGSYLPLVADPAGPQMPTIANPCIPGYSTIWQAFELTLPGDGTISCNTTNVDQVGIPITAEIQNSDGSSTKVGFTASRSDLVKAFFRTPSYSSLVIRGPKPSDPPLRILSPEHVAPGLGIPPRDMDHFFKLLEGYINRCWAQWTTAPIELEDSSGDVYHAQVKNGILGFWDNAELSGTPLASWSKPSTLQVLSDQPPVVSVGAGLNPLTYSRFWTAAMHRGVALNAPNGTWCGQRFYAAQPVEQYANLLHQNSIGGLCYAFSFDDVCNQSTLMNTPANATTSELTLTLPAW